MNTYKLTTGINDSLEILFECENPQELAKYLLQNLPPNGAFPMPSPTNGFAILLPDNQRLQGLRAQKWISQNVGRQ